MIESFRQIMESSADVKAILHNAQNYLAHIKEGKKSESLTDHVSHVNGKAVTLVEVHQLDAVIDRLITDIVGPVEAFVDKETAMLVLKRLFVDVIRYHDFGKINENFQVDRMNNRLFVRNKESVLSPAYGHSFLSAYIYLIAHVDEVLKGSFTDQEKLTLTLYAFYLSYVIARHHSPVLEQATDDFYLSSFAEKFVELEKYPELYGIHADNKKLKPLFTYISQIKESLAKEHLTDFPLFALIKLSYSLLTAADYFATHEYTSDTLLTDWGVFNDPLRKKEIIRSLREYKYNKDAYSNVADYYFVHPEARSKDNLNVLRKEMAIEAVQTIRKNLDKRLFYIEAPTGGGKTNLSMFVLSELLEANAEINKVFYVFPFTTLITQTYRALKDVFNLKWNELAELHSKAPLSIKNEERNYGKAYQDYIDHLFALYPITVLSHVKFFDILKTNEKSSNYLLHRLSNAVVIIDELQSYNPKLWDKMIYLIEQFAYYFNIRFVLMSATLPKIDELHIPVKMRSSFVDVLPNAKAYLRNPNFSQRVRFRFDLFESEIDLSDLVRIVIEKSLAYKETSANAGTVHTIIELIYKKTASAFYQEIEGEDHPFDRIFILSGTILEPRRKEIINYIKAPIHRSENILLITTQVVEAGVDIDMDLGFKNVSLIDSDEQLAGRVNRNASKEKAEVYLFRLDNAKTLYGTDERYKAVAENFIGMSQYQSTLETKDFSGVYQAVFNKKNERNTWTGIQNLYSEFVGEGICQLNYGEVNRLFRLIDQKNVTVFVPLPLPVRIESAEKGEWEETFTQQELKFLGELGVFPENGFLNGEDVWAVYEQTICSREGGFDLSVKSNFKMLQIILSKFTFSLFAASKELSLLLSGFGEERYGFIYFSHWNDQTSYGTPYSFDSGLNSTAFNDLQFI